MFVRRSISLQWFRFFCLIILVTFGVNVVGEDAARAWSIAEPQSINMPPAGTLLPSSFAFSLPTLKGISVDPNDPFKIDFVVDSANQNLNEKVNQAQVNLLIKYFLSFLTLPDEDLWVNLSPYEKNRIIISEFETTNAGRDMLVQDYILKQLASSLTYPDHEIGKIFWKKVYSQARAEYGSTNIPINTFSKVWVVPDKAVVYEDNGSAFISSSRLKVLTEEDYLSIEKNRSKLYLSSKKQDIDHLSTQVTREILIPELEREVNQGKYFAPLRQMYNSLILAIWFKKRLKENLISLVYVNQKKISGITLNEKQIKERIYAQYLKAYKKGVYNYIKEESDPVSGQTTPRKYFSGGFSFVDTAMSVTFLPSSRFYKIHDQVVSLLKEGLYRFTVVLKPLGVSQKTLLSLAAGVTLMTGGIHQANAQENHSATPPIVQNSYISSEPIKALQKALNKVDGNTGSLLGNHPGSMGFEKVKRIIDAINDLPSDSPVQNQAQQLKKALGDPQFYKDNVTLRNQGAPKGAYLLMHPYHESESRIAVDDGIKVLKREIAKLLSSTQYIYTATAAPWKPSTGTSLIPAPTVAVASTSAPASVVPAVVPAHSPDITQPVTIQRTTTAAVVPSTVLQLASVPTAAIQPAVDSHVGADQVSAQLEVGVAPIAVQDDEIAGNSGSVTWIDHDKKEFEAGKPIGYLLDPELKSSIEQLNTELSIEKKNLLNLIEQGGTAQDIQTAQQKVDETSQELAKANQEKEAGVIIAPHGLTIEDGTIAPGGTQVNKGERLFRYIDKQRVRVNFNVPTGVSYFNKVKDLTINGVLVNSIVSMNWSFDPLRKNAQVSLEVIVSSPISLGGEVLLKGSILAPDINAQSLNSIIGKTNTLSAIDRVEQIVIRVPVDGPVKFRVHEGQRVLKGQVLAEVYRLNAKHLEVRAPSSGFVISKAGYEKGSFQAQDELLRIGTGNAFVGGINDVTSPVLLPKGVNINNGDPVVVETPWGRLPGQVTAINQTPYSPKIDLGGFQSLEVRAFDQQGILQTNLPVRIILSQDDKDRQIILDALAQAGKSETNVVSAGSPPPPDEEGGLNLFGYSGFSNVPNRYLPSVVGSTNLTSSINLNSLAGLVDNNRLVTGIQAIEVLEKKQEEALPKATRFSVNGGVYMKDGKLYFSGGLMGVLNNMIGGGIQSGNAYAAALPLVEDLFGNIIDVASGKINKEVRLKKKGTEIAIDHMQTEILGQVQKAQNLLIDLGAANQKINQLKNLLSNLEKARLEIGALPGENTGTDTVLDTDHQLEQNIQDIKGRILALQEKQENLTVALNVFVGQSNTNLHQSFKANLPWGKQFGAIDEQRENQLRDDLIATNSPNFKMKEAIAAGQAVDMTVKLQGLDKLPALNMAGLFVNDGNLSSTLINVSPNEGLFRTSEAVSGANGGLQLNIPLFDSVVRTKAGIMALEKEKSQLNLEKTKTDLTQELEQTVASIRSLSGQIQEAEKGYRIARRNLELKIGSNLKLSYQWVGESIEVNKRWQEVVDLKAQYLKEEVKLRAMGLLGEETSTQQDLSDVEKLFQTVVSNAVAGENTNDWQSFYEGSSQLPVDHILSPGVINYQVGTDVSSAWALMHNDSTGSNVSPIRTIKQVLLEDPNLFVRNDALHHFIEEYQNDSEFPSILKDVILNSSYSDVVWELLKFMGQKEDHGIPFFVQLINEAGIKHNNTVVDIGFQSLEDAFTMYPETIQGLTPTDFIDTEIANKVFLTLITRQPDSVASQRLLQSGYWDADDLAKIYNSLLVYNNIHKGDQGSDRIKALSQLVYDTILRKEALANIDETFRSGYFANPSVIVLDGDILTHGRIEEMAQQNSAFLNLSPQWRRMQEYIHPKLYASAQEAANNLLSINQPDPLISLFDDFLGVPAQHNELAYFASLGLEGQKSYITESEKLHNISELARILNLQSLQTPLRALVLDHLMADRQGRLLVLKSYMDSFDPELLQLIEKRSWLDNIKEDVKAVKNSADIQILRGALAKIYDRTQAQWAWNIIDSRTFSDPELHLLSDPRSGAYRAAQIKVVATKVAIGVIEKERDYKWVLWAGYRLQSPQEVDELTRLKQEIDQQINPIKVMDDLDHRAKSVTDSKTKKMLKNIISMRDQIAEKITNNDQSIPKFPLLWWGSGAVILLGSTVLFFKNMFKKIKTGTQNKDTVNNILYIADRVTSLEYMDRLNGTETNEPNRQMVQIRDDGLKIINMPHPRTVEPKAQGDLELWWQNVAKWNNEKNLSKDEILSGFHQMTESALDALITMPYEPKLMQSPSGQYQKTLFYFTTMANYTLYLLTNQLKDKDLNSVQKGQLKRDTERLVGSIKYASNFSLFLHYRANIQRVLTRKLPDSHPLEDKKWWLLGYAPYGIARSYLLFQYLFSKSYKKGNKSIDDLLIEGNALLGLYPNKELIKKEGENYLKDVVSRGGMDQVVRAHDAELTDKIGNFWREIKYPIQAGVILLSTIGSVLVFPGFASFAAEISTFALVFHFWSVWFYAKPNIDFLDTTWSKEINDLANKQQVTLNALFDAAQVTSFENNDAAMAVVVQNSTETAVPDEIDKRIIAQLMTGYSADGAAPELLIPILQKNLSGEAENIIVENANLKKVFYLMRLFKEDSLLNRLKKTNSKEILWESSLKNREEFRPTTIENLNRDLEVIHINVGAREYYFIVGATYPTLVRMKDAAMQIKRQGGVDFSKAESSILFQQNSSTRPNDLSTNRGTPFKSFMGFEFQVIQYRPILNPIELFWGSTIGKKGPLFLSREGSIKNDQA